jgi:predicted SnoaL-like aldol condensation-catalyzing enzyme
MSRPNSNIPVNTTASREVEAANKKLVLDFWFTHINEHDYAQVSKYMDEDYIQNSPSAAQGRTAMINFFKQRLGDDGPLPPDKAKYTDFTHVIAEGDLVTLMFKGRRVDPKDPSKVISAWWYDSYRCKDGKIVEHWDCAVPNS